MGHHKKEKKHSSKEGKRSKKSEKSKHKKKKVQENVDEPKNDEDVSEKPTSDEILESLFNDVKNSVAPIDITTLISEEKSEMVMKKAPSKKKHKKREKSRSRSRSTRKTSKRARSRSRTRSRSRSTSAKYFSKSRAASRTPSRSSDSDKRWRRSRSRSSRSRSRTWSRSPVPFRKQFRRHSGGGGGGGGGYFRSSPGRNRFCRPNGSSPRRFGTRKHSPSSRSDFRSFHNRKRRATSLRFSEKDYTDEFGEIDKQKLLEIATKNATKLAMEGKLPKGVELLDTMKNKTITELVSICKQLHDEEDLMEKVSSDDEDRYDRRYERWRRTKVEKEDDEFVPRPVRSTGEIKINILNANSMPTKTPRERIEEEGKLRTSFPVSSGAQHRDKSEWVPVIKPAGEGIGPLTTALGKIKTNIPAAYRPPPQPPTDLFPTAPKNVESLSAAFDTSQSASTTTTTTAVKMAPPPVPPNAAAILAEEKKPEIPATLVPKVEAAPALLISLPPPPKPPVLLASFDKPSPSAEMLEELKRKAAIANSQVISATVSLPALPITPSPPPPPPPPSNPTITSSSNNNNVPSTLAPISQLSAVSQQMSLPDIGPVPPQQPTFIWPVSTRDSHKSDSQLSSAVIAATVSNGGSLNDSTAALVSAFAVNSTSAYGGRRNDFVFPETQGKTKAQRSVQELVAERLKYSTRLKEDPNDYRARKQIIKIDEEMSLWAQTTNEPGKFSGSTGARVLTAEELAPRNPRFQAWVKRDIFKTATEVSGGVGMKLLQKMGWQPGSGLGKDGAGQLEPLSLDVKSDRRGLQSTEDRRMSKKECVLDVSGKNPVSVVMEYCSKNHLRHPEFTCMEVGNMGSKRFLWKAVLNGVEYQPSLPSSNKKAGKSQVCLVMLEALGMRQS